MKKALFIALEGIDGSGKSTQAALLKQHLDGLGLPVVLTREPGGTSLGEEVRSLLLREGAVLQPLAEALLYLAVRAQHVAEVIRPALDRGITVISDRFSASTMAYQGFGRGIGLELLEQWNRQASKDLSPDLNILLDIDPAAGMQRLSRPPDRMEGEGIEFLRRVRNGYLHMAAMQPGNYLVLDAGQSPGAVFKAMVKGLAGYGGLTDGTPG